MNDSLLALEKRTLVYEYFNVWCKYKSEYACNYLIFRFSW